MPFLATEMYSDLMKESDIQEIKEGLEAFKKTVGFFGGNIQGVWKLESFIRQASTIFARSPFNVGDKVILTYTPDITPEKAWGWMHAKHFLVEGAIGTIKERFFYDGRFDYYIAFDNDSHMNADGDMIPSTEKGLYSFSETRLTKYSESDVQEHMTMSMDARSIP